MTSPSPFHLDVSLVTYAPDPVLVGRTLGHLAAAIDVLGNSGGVRLFLIDNGPGHNAETLERLAAPVQAAGAWVEILTGHGNVGYGAGHDLALMDRGAAPHHLILNPDVEMEPDALRVGLNYLAAHPHVVMVTPRSEAPDGTFQYLCKRPPGLLTLAARGFAPAAIQRFLARRLDHYELRDRLGPETKTPVGGIPIASGCFMLMKADVARTAGGFGSTYFLYFEDFDLSLRLAQHGDIVYLPAMRIRHAGGGAGRKGWRHLVMFGRSAWTYFRRWGWSWV